MPCDSNVTETKLNDADRLEKALVQAGHKVVRRGDNSIQGGGLHYYRGSKNEAFSLQMDAGSEKNQVPVARQYAEIGVRTWAQKRGYSVLDADGTNMTLVNRRGGGGGK